MRESSSSARRAIGRSPDFSPPFSARRRAVRLHCGRVDENLRRRPAGLRERLEDVRPRRPFPPIGRSDCRASSSDHSPAARRPSGLPDFSTWMMPLITRRSSTRALPRVSVGRCGAIFENCSVRQPKLIPIHLRLPFGSRESQSGRSCQCPLWVRTLRPHLRRCLLLGGSTTRPPAMIVSRSERSNTSLMS